MKNHFDTRTARAENNAIERSLTSFLRASALTILGIAIVSIFAVPASAIDPEVPCSDCPDIRLECEERASNRADACELDAKFWFEENCILPDGSHDLYCQETFQDIVDECGEVLQFDYLICNHIWLVCRNGCDEHC